MLLTQETAGFIYCPILSRTLLVNCLGKKCAAWRWLNPKEYNDIGLDPDDETQYAYCGHFGMVTYKGYD